MQDSLLGLVATVVTVDAVLLVLLLGATVHVLREQETSAPVPAPVV